MSIEAMKLALEALEEVWYHVGTFQPTEEAIDLYNEAKTALRQAIEQAQQEEPDYYGLTKDHLWMSITKDHYDRLKPEFRMACYTSPPPHEPLTDWEIDELSRTMVKGNKSVNWLARAIEAAVLEKQK